MVKKEKKKKSQNASTVSKAINTLFVNSFMIR